MNSTERLRGRGCPHYTTSRRGQWRRRGGRPLCELLIATSRPINVKYCMSRMVIKACCEGVSVSSSFLSTQMSHWQAQLSNRRLDRDRRQLSSLGRGTTLQVTHYRPAIKGDIPEREKRRSGSSQFTMFRSQRLRAANKGKTDKRRARRGEVFVRIRKGLLVGGGEGGGQGRTEVGSLAQSLACGLVAVITVVFDAPPI